MLAAVTLTVLNTVADTTPPASQITAPSGGSVISGAVSVTASAADNVGVTKVDLYIDGSLFSSTTSGTPSFEWTTTSVSNGSHALQAKAYDAAGNVGVSPTVSVTVSNPDTAPPAVQFTFPEEGATLSGIVNLSLAATDNVGVTKIELYVDGAKLATSSGASLNFAWNTGSTSNGAHTLKGIAYDAVGNNNSVTIVVNVSNAVLDTIAPAVGKNFTQQRHGGE